MTGGEPEANTEFGSGVEVQYEVTMADMVEFNRYHMAHSPTVRRSLRTARVLASAGFVAIGIVISVEQGTFTGLAVFGLASVLWFLLMPALVRRRTIKTVRRMLSEGEGRGLLGKCTLSIAVDGSRVVRETGESTFAWCAVDRIVTAERYVYIYVGATSALVIPKSAFADPAGCEWFVERARAWHEAALRPAAS